MAKASDKNSECVLKLIIVGESSVGKSNLMSQFIDKRFYGDHDVTIGVEFATKNINIQNKIYKLQVWDTAGQETFRSITQAYYRGTVGCLLVYDITDRKTFERLDRWIGEIKQSCNNNAVIILAGNKSDLEQMRAVEQEEGKLLAEKHKLLFFETSAKTNNNVDQCFRTMIGQIVERIDNGSIQMNSAIRLTNPPTSEKSSCCWW